MAYSKTACPRSEPAFTPFASILDLIANVGPAASEYLRPATVNWRAFKHEGSPD
jgi:hypothetical protein